MVVCLAAARLHAESNDSPETLKDAQVKVHARLEQFSKTHDAELLVEAGKLAASMNPRGGSDALSKLDEGSLRLQLEVIVALAAARDPHYDRNAATNRVYLNVMPPLNKGTEILVSGMDPKAIKDPEVRKAYEDALAENARREEKLRREMAISRALEHAEIKVWVFVMRGLRDGSEARKSAVGIIDQTVFDKNIRSRLEGDSMPGLTW